MGQYYSGGDTYRLIVPLEPANTALVAIPLLVMVTAMSITLTTRDRLPQLANLNRLQDIPAHVIAIEEVGRMDVVTPPVIAVSLLHCINVSDKALKDRMAAVLGDQDI